jgi:hypothetical protein
MTGKTKALGVMLGALALLALAATSAPAATPHTFTSDSPNGRTVLTARNEPGTQGKHTLGKTGGATATVTCEEEKFEGTVVGSTADEVTLKPTFTGCKAAGNNANVRTNHCAYVFDSDTEEQTAGSGQEHARVELECAPESSIEVEIPGIGATLHTKAQKPNHGVTYSSIKEKAPVLEHNAITVKATVRDIVYSCTGPGCFLLPNGGNGSDGHYNAEVNVTGYEDTDIARVGTEATTPDTTKHSETAINLGLTTP